MKKRIFQVLTGAAIVVSAFAALYAADRWVQGSNGRTAGGDIYGGWENGRSLILCAGFYNGTYHPGKLVGNACNYGYGGREIRSASYYTLKVQQGNISNYKWFGASNGNIPMRPGYQAIPVGREGSRTLYVCRANYMGGKHPGKIVGSNCNFGYGGREITVPTYQVLMRQQ